MPFYDYACTSCGQRIEVMHAVNDSGPGACERCGGRMRKMLSSPAIVFKGTGWAKKERSAAAAAGTGAKQDGGPADGSAAEPAPGGDSVKPDAAGAQPKPDSKPEGGVAKGNGTGDSA